MPDYRIYRIDKNDRVISRKEIVAPNDETALEAARQFLDDVDVEVWDHARKVGRPAKNNRRPRSRRMRRPPSKSRRVGPGGLKNARR